MAYLLQSIDCQMKLKIKLWKVWDCPADEREFFPFQRKNGVVWIADIQVEQGKVVEMMRAMSKQRPRLNKTGVIKTCELVRDSDTMKWKRGNKGQ